MDKKQLKALVLDSFADNQLNFEKVKKTAYKLSRQNLKQFIRFLKEYEKKISVIVVMPFVNTKIEKKMFEDLYPRKKIIFKKDSSLIAGVRIIEDDMVYDFNLKHTLDNVATHIKNNYE